MSLQSRDYLDSPSFVERFDPPCRGVAGRGKDARRDSVKAERRRPGGSGRAAQPGPVPPSPSQPQPGPDSPSLALEAHRGGGGGGRVRVRHGQGPRASGAHAGSEGTLPARSERAPPAPRGARSGSREPDKNSRFLRDTATAPPRAAPARHLLRDPEQSPEKPPLPAPRKR